MTRNLQIDHTCRRPLFALISLLILFNTATGQSFQPMADAYIYDAAPNSNYGTVADIAVKKGTSANFRKGYLRFDLTGVSGSSVSQAVLRLYASTAVAIGINVYESGDGWTETGITWNNAPAAGPLVSSVPIPATPGYCEWDVTQYVQAELNNADPVISFHVFPSVSGSAVIKFNSREAQDYSPELVITQVQSPPEDPSDLRAAAVSSSEIALNWEDQSVNESGFIIERKTGSGAFAELAATGSETTAYKDHGLPASTTFTYRVRAFNSGGSSGYTQEEEATTDSYPGITYYMNAVEGSDLNSGLSPSQAWKTLGKVNAFSFTPGSRILFKAGQVWTGRLYPKGSGSPGNPIIIDMYGTGSKPLINGNGLTGTGVVYLYNQQYWEISNLEIINDAATGGDRRGVRIEAENFGTARHIFLKNLLIHNIKGLVGQGRPEKRTSGIGFAIVSAGLTETHFDSIMVEDCVIHSCENQGIITECVEGDGYDPYTPEWNAIKITNAVIRNNTIYNISKNAMIIRLFESGVVERNVCYNTANGISGNTMFTASCYGTVFQYNEGFDNHSPDADGSMYDADLRSPATVWQYSYSHNNAHGLFWTCTVQADANVVCRYNISQNDQGIIFCINYPVTSVHVYNNTVYIPPYLSPVVISERNNGGGGSRTYTFRNNLIYNLSATTSYLFTSGYNRTIDYNCFYGIHPSSEPADPHKVTGDPKLVSAGSGGVGNGSVNGYKTTAGSSCINTGTIIPSNGVRDYWGNDLYNGLPDIGAYEYPEKSGNGGLWSQPGTWAPSGVPTGTSNVTLLSGTVIVDTPAAVCNALTLASGSSMLVGNGMKLLVKGAISRGGQESLVVNGGAWLDNSGEIELKRNITLPSSGVLQMGTGVLNLAGNSHQRLSGSFSTGTLSMNNPGGCSAGGSIRAVSQLTLQAGRIRTGAWNLTLGSASVVSGTLSPSAMVVTNGAGQVIRELNPGYSGTFTFPVGDMNESADYSPITVNITDGSAGNASSLGVRVVNSPYPDSGITGNYLKRYWNLAIPDGDSIQAGLSFRYSPGDVAGEESLLSCSRMEPLHLVTYGQADPALHALTATGAITSGSYTGLKSLNAFPVQQLSNITIGDFQSACYDATVNLEAGGTGNPLTILPGGSVLMVSGNQIGIGEGVTVHQGGYFRAWITTSGNYCFNPEPALPSAVQSSAEVEPALPSCGNGVSVHAYPNPTEGGLTLELGGIGTEVVSALFIFNIRGDMVLKTSISAHRTLINLTDLPGGIYIAKICLSTETKTIRLIRI